jgi:hypothetical protein
MVFLVQHVHKQGSREVTRIIGIYSSRELAAEAVSRLQLAPGFRDSPSGFSIDEYEKNADHWLDGFEATRAKWTLPRG